MLCFQQKNEDSVTQNVPVVEMYTFWVHNRHSISHTLHGSAITLISLCMCFEGPLIHLGTNEDFAMIAENNTQAVVSRD